MKKMICMLLSSALMVVTLSSCNTTTSPSDSTSSTTSFSSTAVSSSEDTPDPITLTIAAAASLEDCLTTQLIPMFQEEYPWITVEGSYDSSGKLQTQLESGLDAGVFMSAATKQMDALVEQDIIDANTVVPLLENQVVLITSSSSETTVSSFADISNASTIAIGDPTSVPAGTYSQEILTTLGVWDSIQPKLSLATNVTEVLHQVSEGSAEVGIVYATDAAQLPDQVRIIASAPEGSLQTPVIYPVGILKNSSQTQAAELFVAFLQTPQAMEVFEENGFIKND